MPRKSRDEDEEIEDDKPASGRKDDDDDLDDDDDEDTIDLDTAEEEEEDEDDDDDEEDDEEAKVVSVDDLERRKVFQSEAEEILERAEVEEAMAEVRVWQAVLAIGYAQGDLKPFLQLAHLAEGST